MKPELSRAAIGSLPSERAHSKASLKTPSEVSRVRTTSTSFITGTGLKLVEVVRTLLTSDATFERAFEFARSLGKEPIACRDNSGFIVNRLLVPYLLDAIRALEEGVGTVEDIDKGMQLGCGYPMGPFTLLDFVGLDTTYYIANIMFEEYREKRFAPPPLLKQMVTAGRLGRKSGRGFYEYAKK